MSSVCKRGLVVALVWVFACSSEPDATTGPEQDIIGGDKGGSNDTGDPAVVWIQAAKNDGSQKGWGCTGSVIAKRVILTAAHCVEDAVVGRTTFQVIFAPDRRQSTTANTINVTRWDHDPAFLTGVNANNLAGGHDAAVLILAKDAPAEPLIINTATMTNSMIGQPAYVVGYGNNNGQAATGAGTKRALHTKLNGLQQGVAVIGEAGHSTCQGDSGGPTFMTLGGRQVIIGITSYGLQGCVSSGSVTRVDLAARWIQPFVDSNGGAGTGQPDSDAGTGVATGSGDGTNGGGNAGGAGAGTGGGTGVTPPDNGSCVYSCLKYHYAVGQCYQGWYCLDDGCLGVIQGGC